MSNTNKASVLLRQFLYQLIQCGNVVCHNFNAHLQQSCYLVMSWSPPTSMSYQMVYILVWCQLVSHLCLHSESHIFKPFFLHNLYSFVSWNKNFFFLSLELDGMCFLVCYINCIFVLFYLFLFRSSVFSGRCYGGGEGGSHTKIQGDIL